MHATIMEEAVKPAIFLDQHGCELPELVSPPEVDSLIQGDILKTIKVDGRRRYFEIAQVEEQHNAFVARCRPITPRYLNGVVLAGGLAAGWWAIQFALKFLGLGA